MSTSKERENFFFTMARECPKATPYDIRTILRLTATHGRLQEAYCNGVAPQQQRRNEKLEQSVQRRIADMGILLGFVPVFGGDPRGATVKLKVPSGRYDDWGQEGLCVPQ